MGLPAKRKASWEGRTRNRSQRRFEAEELLRKGTHEVVAEQQRSVVVLSGEDVEEGSSDDAGNDHGGEDNRLDPELDGEEGGQEDDEDLEEAEGDVEEDSLAGGKADTADDEGAKLREGTKRRGGRKGQILRLDATRRGIVVPDRIFDVLTQYRACRR